MKAKAAKAGGAGAAAAPGVGSPSGGAVAKQVQKAKAIGGETGGNP